MRKTKSLRSDMATEISGMMRHLVSKNATSTVVSAMIAR